jgi:hypothetical protein
MAKISIGCGMCHCNEVSFAAVNYDGFIEGLRVAVYSCFVPGRSIVPSVK